MSRSFIHTRAVLFFLGLILTSSIGTEPSAHAMSEPSTPSSCVTSDPNHICMGLKLVSYTINGAPVVSLSQAVTLVERINKVWGQCNIAFQLEKYETVDAESKGLTNDVNWENDGDKVRSAFNENSSFLVVAVGTLTGKTIAVTEMPGAGVYGTLVASAYANNELTVGHELGHYQGLYHLSDETNLMSPYIGPNTAGLSALQCSIARATDIASWQAMTRHR